MGVDTQQIKLELRVRLLNNGRQTTD